MKSIQRFIERFNRVSLYFDNEEDTPIEGQILNAICHIQKRIELNGCPSLEDPIKQIIDLVKLCDGDEDVWQKIGYSDIEDATVKIGEIRKNFGLPSFSYNNLGKETAEFNSDGKKIEPDITLDDFPDDHVFSDRPVKNYTFDIE